MKWYQYFAIFFAGIFLANAVPHFVNGISGNFFPSPFADPPGIGLSSPLTNVLWAILNMVVGYALVRYSRASQRNRLAVILFIAGITAMSVMLSIGFADKVTP